MKKKKSTRWFILKHLSIDLGVIILTLKLKSYQNIPKYYKSLIYVSLFNLVYYILCRRKLLWAFTPFGMPWKLIRTVQTLLITPLLVLGFLSKYPTSLFHQIRYMTKWVLVSTGIEYLTHKQKLIMYKHGWNICWSGMLYLMMFALSKLYSIRPKLTWLLSLGSVIFFMKKFKVPLRKKHLSSKFERAVDLFYHSFPEDLF